MAYAVRADLTNFGVTASLLTGLSDDQLDAQLQAKSDFADGHIGSRYTLPLTVWGDDLRECVCVLAVESLLALKGHAPKDGARDALATRAAQWRAWLLLIGEGKVTISGGVTTPATGGPTIVTSAWRGPLH